MPKQTVSRMDIEEALVKEFDDRRVAVSREQAKKVVDILGVDKALTITDDLHKVNPVFGNFEPVAGGVYK